MATEADPLAALSITDVVVIPAVDDDSDASRAAGDPPVQLLTDLHLRRLPTADALAYQQACEPRHLNFDPADPGGGHRYAFVRHPAPPGSVHTLPTFDPDGLLHDAVMLSRYLVPNSHCTDTAARRIEGLQLHGVEIVALAPESRFYAWSVRDGSRTLLTPQDARELGPLLATYRRDHQGLPPRVRLAIWFCEMSFRTRYYETACVHVVTAMEALLKVRTHDATVQFGTRVPALARAVGITGITKRRAETFYGRRSRSVHGRPLRVDAFVPATRELATMQRLLTAALRKAIEEPEFRGQFTGPKIEQRWPVTRRRRRRGRAPGGI